MGKHAGVQKCLTIRSRGRLAVAHSLQYLLPRNSLVSTDLRISEDRAQATLPSCRFGIFGNEDEYSLLRRLSHSSIGCNRIRKCIPAISARWWRYSHCVPATHCSISDHWLHRGICIRCRVWNGYCLSSGAVLGGIDPSLEPLRILEHTYKEGACSN